MIIKARHHWFVYPFFQYYTLWLMKKHFNRISIHGSFSDKGLPILLLANHFSWWDGFFAVFLNYKILHRKFHVMMLEEQLKKYWFFSLSGAFSVKKHARSIMDTIDYANELLTANRNMVVVYPQGRIRSVYETQLHFEKGVARIIYNSKNNIQVLFMASLVDYLSHKKPDITIYIEEYKDYNKRIDVLEDEYNSFYSKCRMMNCDLAGS